MLLFTLYPSLETCSSLLGDYFCTPTGLFLAMVASIPGYLLVGNIVTYLPTLPVWVSLILVFIVTTIIYFAFGLLIDKLFSEKKSKVTAFIIVSFIILPFFA